MRSILAMAIVASISGAAGAEAGTAKQAAPGCDDGRAVWRAEWQDRIYATYNGRRGQTTEVFLEEWREGKLAWRAEGKITCGNGASICVLTVPNNSDIVSGNSESGTEADVETIDDERDGLSEYVVYASLAQKLYYADGLAVKQWSNGFKAGGERITPPNVYKLVGCRASAEDDASSLSELLRSR